MSYIFYRIFTLQQINNKQQVPESELIVRWFIIFVISSQKCWNLIGWNRVTWRAL